MGRYDPESHQVRIVFHVAKYGSFKGPEGDRGFYVAHDVYRAKGSLEWRIGAPHNCCLREDAVEVARAFDLPVIGWVEDGGATWDHYGDVEYATQGIYKEVHLYNEQSLA